MNNVQLATLKRYAEENNDNDLLWLVEQSMKAQKYERALIDISVNCTSPAFRVVAERALRED